VAKTIGIVVPTLGQRADWLSQTLESIRSQSYLPRKLAIVGPPTTRLEELAARHGAQLLLDRGTGLSGALNIGWRHLKEAVDYWTWLGDDDLLAPGAFECIVSALEAKPSALYGYGRTRIIDADGRSLCLTIPTSWAPLYARFGQDYIPQPGSLIRVQPLRDEENLLDETLLNAMDLELFLRLSAPGRKAWVYVAREVSASRAHEGSITHNKRSMDESEAARSRFRSPVANSIMRRVTRPRRLLERVYVKLQWTFTGRRQHRVYYGPTKRTSR
jgi:GT2 family glycosyltransferase